MHTFETCEILPPVLGFVNFLLEKQRANFNNLILDCTVELSNKNGYKLLGNSEHYFSYRKMLFWREKRSEI